ncbi:MAG: FtsH protease activity modulator HflK [Alkalispirochaetaceae bacterium]
MSERDVTPPQLPFTLKPKTIAIIIVVAILVAIGASSFFVVDQTEQAVVLLLGRYNRTAGPGLHFKLPFGIERSHTVPTQVVQNMSFGFRTERPGITSVRSDVDYPEESIMLTGDLNIVDVEWIIQYRIVDPQAWLFNVESQEKTIRDISQSVVNELVGDRAIVDVLGKERPPIETQGQENMNEILQDYGLGINVTAVRLQNIVPPAGRVQDAFEDVNRAVQDMNRLINEGREAYNEEIPRARGQADQMVQVAEGYAAERVNDAQGNSARFDSVLGEYQQAPETTRTRLYFEMVENVFREQEETQLVDRNLSNFIPFLNLNQGTSGEGSFPTVPNEQNEGGNR